MKYWDDKYRSQYREYVEYPERLKEAMRHSNFTSKKYVETFLGATCDDDDYRTSLHEESNAIVHSKGTSQAYWDAIRPGVRTSTSA